MVPPVCLLPFTYPHPIFSFLSFSRKLTGENYLESILNVSLFKKRNIRREIYSVKDMWYFVDIAEDITENIF